MNYLEKIIGAIEEHSLADIRDCFENGLSPNEIFRNEPLLFELTSEYTRSARFKDCVKLFIEYGLRVEDKALLAVLCDDAAMLKNLLDETNLLLRNKYNLRCAYTQMKDVSLLHICAEFNHVACAEVLVESGVAVNVLAGTDENGFGAQTPIFHTVNQNSNQSKEMMHYLLEKGADLHYQVKGIIWGKSYEWETFIPAVNPISYALMGRLPQMHRNEKTVAETVSLLMKYGYDIEYEIPNIPNKYLLA